MTYFHSSLELSALSDQRVGDQIKGDHLNRADARQRGTALLSVSHSGRCLVKVSVIYSKPLISELGDVDGVRRPSAEQRSATSQPHFIGTDVQRELASHW